MIKVATRLDLIRMLPQGSKVAEIGVHRGKFSKQMLDLPNLGMVYLIDSWGHFEDYNDPITETDQMANMAETMKVIGGHIPGGRVKVVRSKSMEAAFHFNVHDMWMDAVYIDANHSYDSVYNDLKMWAHNLSKDGILLGHDFCDNHPLAKKHGWGVETAVADFCKYHSWKLEYLTTDDEFPSFGLKRI